MRSKNKILLFTTSTDFLDIYEYLIKQENMCCVAVPENRAESIRIKEIRQICEEKGIELLVHPQKKENLAPFHTWIQDNKFNLGLCWSYSQIIKKETLELFKDGIWNMHGGKIPEYRGANVLQWAIINGETEIGVTWHIVDEKIDHGDILKADIVEIEEEDTAAEISEKVLDKGKELFFRLWEEAVTQGVRPYKADMEKGMYWRARNPLDGIITQDMDIQEIKNLIRAQCPPWPAPFLIYENKVFRVLGIEDGKDEGAENVIKYRNNKCLVFLRIQPETEEEMIQQVLRRAEQQ